MDWGAVLKSARKREGLTQEELAERLHMTKSCISKFESNLKETKISTFVEWFRQTNATDLMIAAMINVDPSQVAQLIELIGQLAAFALPILSIFG